MIARERRPLRALLILLAALALGIASLIAVPQTSQAAGSLPCDIYAASGTPCVAAHSTTRALYSAYNGSVYQVKRASDNPPRNIGLTSAGEYGDAAAQDAFFANATCLIA